MLVGTVRSAETTRAQHVLCTYKLVLQSRAAAKSIFDLPLQTADPTAKASRVCTHITALCSMEKSYILSSKFDFRYFLVTVHDFDTGPYAFVES